MTCYRISDGIICSIPEFKPGDPRPAGYLAFDAWAEVQAKGGLKQEACGICGRYCFPQEMSDMQAESVTLACKPDDPLVIKHRNYALDKADPFW